MVVVVVTPLKNCGDVARELVERGVEDPKRFVPNAELTVERERIVIRDEGQVSDPGAIKLDHLESMKPIFEI